MRAREIVGASSRHSGRSARPCRRRRWRGRGSRACPKCFSTSAKTASMVAGIGHVAMAGDMRAELGGERLDPLLEGIALIGERELGALRGAGLGDAPGDRAVVGDAHDEAALALPSMRPKSPFSVLQRRPLPIAQGQRPFKERGMRAMRTEIGVASENKSCRHAVLARRAGRLPHPAFLSSKPPQEQFR